MTSTDEAAIASSLVARNRRLGLLLGAFVIAITVITITAWAWRGLPQGPDAVRAWRQRQSATPVAGPAAATDTDTAITATGSQP